MAHRFEDLNNLFQNNLLLGLDEYELSGVVPHGFVCNFLGLRVSSAFQPLFGGEGQLVGREALLRATVHEHYELLPEAAFDDAIRENRLVQFDRLVRTIHLLNHVSHFSPHELIFHNVHPHLLTRVEQHGRFFERILQHYAVPTSQVVIEIKESAVADRVRLSEAVANFRSVGYQVAIANVGQGGTDDAALERVIELAPDLVKIDGSVSRSSSATGELARLVGFFHNAGIKVVVAGIETAAQLSVAKSAAADLYQGFFLGSPEYVLDAVAVVSD